MAQNTVKAMAQEAQNTNTIAGLVAPQDAQNAQALAQFKISVDAQAEKQAEKAAKAEAQAVLRSRRANVANAKAQEVKAQAAEQTAQKKAAKAAQDVQKAAQSADASKAVKAAQDAQKAQDAKQAATGYTPRRSQIETVGRTQENTISIAPIDIPKCVADGAEVQFTQAVQATYDRLETCVLSDALDKAQDAAESLLHETRGLALEDAMRIFRENLRLAHEVTKAQKAAVDADLKDDAEATKAAKAAFKEAQAAQKKHTFIFTDEERNALTTYTRAKHAFEEFTEDAEARKTGADSHCRAIVLYTWSRFRFTKLPLELTGITGLRHDIVAYKEAFDEATEWTDGRKADFRKIQTKCVDVLNQAFDFKGKTANGIFKPITASGFPAKNTDSLISAVYGTAAWNKSGGTATVPMKERQCLDQLVVQYFNWQGCTTKKTKDAKTSKKKTQVW